MTTANRPAIIPNIFHTTAVKKQLTWEERFVLRRNMKLLQGWSHMIWTAPDIDKLMKENFSDLYGDYHKITSGVIKADIGRYAFLYKHGGIYADTDYKFLKYPAKLMDATCTLPVEYGRAPTSSTQPHDPIFRLGNAIMASVPEYSFWRHLMESIFRNNSLDDLHQRDPIETTGPIAVTKFYLDNMDKYPEIELPNAVLYLPDLTWSRIGIAKSKESVGVHMCWGSWRSRGLLHDYRTVARRKISAIV